MPITSTVRQARRKGKLAGAQVLGNGYCIFKPGKWPGSAGLCPLPEIRIQYQEMSEMEYPVSCSEVKGYAVMT
jgi:hypothetical protein